MPRFPVLSYTALKAKPRTLQALTSLSVSQFEALLPSFGAALEASVDTAFITEKNGPRPRKRSFGGGRRSRLTGVEEKLLFILMYFKLYPLQEVQGVFWGLSQAQANAWIHRLTPVLQQALGYEMSLPRRKPRDLDEVLGACVSLEFFIDGTERRIQRPQEAQAQKQNYSGKKKTHTRKNLIISDAVRRIHFLSATCEGKKHDKRIADEEEYRFPSGSTRYQDTGFQGYKPELIKSNSGESKTGESKAIQIQQPKKKPRGGELSAEEKEANRHISAVRIRVEHALSGVKRCRIVKDVLRNRLAQFDDLIMETACGLHNFHLSNPMAQNAK